ncbi:ATP-binding cassette domain-containing protein [Actinocatenispora comari]|uniref:ATP-binding cassette domain-containing protein n=1 Tax=Actinocatenispora comari TaxID=2807577 RepID=UPI001A91D131|nr:ATP-binding cassette domain-containing protein [Actinocatenispora comari]
MGYVDVAGVAQVLPDGRELFADVSFRVGEGAKVALVGANGAGKTTLVSMVAGDSPVHTGAIARSGGLGVMRQFIGMNRAMPGIDAPHGAWTLGDLALSLAPPTVREAGRTLAEAERRMRAEETRGKFSNVARRAQVRYAEALAAWGDAGGYEAEVAFDVAAIEVLDAEWPDVKDRRLDTLSGGEQKRFALELLLAGPDEVLLLDEPDNFLDVPAKRRLERQLTASDKSILYVSHDRELLANTADRVVTLESGSCWTHGGGFATWHQAREDRYERLDELRRRWDEEHAKIKQLVLMYREKAKYNSDMASRLQAAKTRLAKFEEAGPPPERPRDQDIRIDLRGGRTGKRAIRCEQLSLTGLTDPFDLEVWYGDRVAVLGANGTGKSHLLRLLALGGTDPEPGTVLPGTQLKPVAHTGVARLGARVRPGHFSQTHDRPELAGRSLRDILWHGDEDRPGMDRSAAMKALSRYELALQSEQDFGTLSGGQQARFLILLLELSGATLLLLDEPTDNLDLVSAEALEAGLASFAGTVVAVTHDRWFTRGFDRFVTIANDGTVTETPEPVWDVR